MGPEFLIAGDERTKRGMEENRNAAAATYRSELQYPSAGQALTLTDQDDGP